MATATVEEMRHVQFGDYENYYSLFEVAVGKTHRRPTNASEGRTSQQTLDEKIQKELFEDETESTERFRTMWI